MMNNLLEQLRKFDDFEQVFGQEFLDTIQYGECEDAYLVKVSDLTPITLMKKDSFECNYFSLIAYLTEMKNIVMNGGTPDSGSRYHHDWLIYKIHYNIRKACFYLHTENVNDPDEVTDSLIYFLGKSNYHALTKLFNTSSEDYLEHAENVMIYIGNTRAIRDLCMKYLDPILGTQWQFHLWHMTPTTIIETYGDIFYLGNELSRLDYCPFDYQAEEYYYSRLYTQLYQYMSKDIPKNKHITKEMKKEIWKEICRDVLDKEPALEDFLLDEWDE